MLTNEQVKELEHLKSFYPFRHVWGVIIRDTGEFQAHATLDRRRMYKLARAGNHVEVLSTNPLASESQR